MINADSAKWEKLSMKETINVSKVYRKFLGLPDLW